MGLDLSDLERKENSPGRAPFVPTDEDRAVVKRMAAAGAIHDDIAAAIGVSKPTLRKAFAVELKERLGDDNLFSAAGEPEPGEAPAPARIKRRGAGGRKKFQPKESDREKVTLLIATGMRVEEIAIAMDIAEPTLRKHFKSELETGVIRKRAEQLVRLDRAASKGNVQAIRELRAIFGEADLKVLNEQLTRKPKADDAPKKEEPIGKKAQADLNAHSVVTKGPWADLVRKPQRAG